VALSVKKDVLRAVNRVASHLPYSFRLLGVHSGFTELNGFRNRLLYEHRSTQPLSFKTLRGLGTTAVVLSSAPRLLKGGGVLSVSPGIANRHGAVYTAGGDLIVSRDDVYEFDVEKALAQYPTLLPQVLKVPEPVAALATPDFNYFHWMFDALPKIHLLDRAGYKEIRLYLQVTENLQQETLDLLGVRAERVIDARRHKFVRASELVVPNYVDRVGACKVLETKHRNGRREVIVGNLDSCVGVSDWICGFLRSKFLDVGNGRSRTPSRVYVSRADATKTRGIKHETRFFEQIERWGFERVVLSEMTFRDQLNLFKNADVVIAPHGAGLTNLVFCTSGAKCLELFSPSYVSDLYAVLSAVLGIDYYYLIGNGSPDPQRVRSNDAFDINPEKLEQFLELAGVAS
jgi:Glycosyltransferase 61